MAVVTHTFAPIFAALPDIDYDWPETPFEWMLYGGGFALVIGVAVLLYVVEIRAMQKERWLDWAMGGWLAVLRLGLIVTLVWIALNPHVRDTKMAYRPSRVVVLVDTSLSMGYPATAPPVGAGTVTDADRQTRAEAVQAFLEQSPLIEKLRQKHQVSVYTFDSSLHGRQSLFVEYADDPTRPGRPRRDTEEEESQPPDWEDTLRPRGLDTRLGEALYALIRAESGRTLSAIVVVSDGNSNAGIDAETVHRFAAQNKVRLITVGVGSTEKQMNLSVANIQAPTDVHVSDPYELTAFVVGQNVGQRPVEVQLLARPADDDKAEPVPVETREVTLAADGVPVEVKFARTPEVAGSLQYLVRVRSTTPIRELDQADNEAEKVVTIVDRKTRVLLMAGGPMRDYRFVRNMLFRHGAVEMDVWLQTVQPATATLVSQESNELLTQFPDTKEKLFDYDVIAAFDPDWSQVPEEGRANLVEWVADHAGGMILIAGDVYTPRLASEEEELGLIQELYPVFLGSYLLDFQYNSESDQPWKLGFTSEGENAGFLQLADEPARSATVWEEFAGVYRAYPTAGAKAGATVYAHFTDPRTQTEHGQPILLASQFYGSGRTLYLGSAEIWRLRSQSDEIYDRFWTKTIREIGQGRLKRGASRAMLLPERDEYYLGQTVRVRARLLDPQYEPLSVPEVAVEVVDPTGRPLIPALTLQHDPARPGQYVGDFRVSKVGKYALELKVPETDETVTHALQVRLPNVEAQHAEQNAKLLTDLARETGGRYLPLDDLAALARPFASEIEVAALERSLASPGLPSAEEDRLEDELRRANQRLRSGAEERSKVEEELSSLIPNRSEEFPLRDQIHTLWDRQFMLYLLVLILSVEWLTRKLLKMA